MQHQQILIATHKKARTAALCQIEKWLISRIPARDRTPLSDIDDLTKGKVVGKQLPPLVSG